MKKFSIKLISDEQKRPLISIRVIEYFEEFVYKNILERKSIIIHSKPNILLAFTIMKTGGKVRNEVKVLKAQTVNGDKLISIIIPLDQILANNTSMKIIELFFESIRNFFTENYKSVTNEFMEKLWEEIDVEYLLSISYPAPKDEVWYIGDSRL